MRALGLFGGEVRGEASYELTRDINLRFGVTFLDLGQGIGRGDLLYVTEVFTRHPWITPLTRFGVAVPTTLYSIAYF